MSCELIQIIEDEFDHAVLLDRTLRKAKFRTCVARDGEMGLQDVQKLRPTVILLDVMLPGIDGYEVCRRVRADRVVGRTPIIMLSALGTLIGSRLAGLGCGADDYIAKPFESSEVLARVRALLRRTRSFSDEHTIAGSDLVLENRYVVVYRGRRVELSERQWKILQSLASRVGHVMLREELTAIVWEDDGLIYDHQLEREIQQLNQALAPDGVPHIVKVSGGAYRWLPS